MLNRLDLRGVSDLAGSLPRPLDTEPPPLQVVRDIIDDVRTREDDALRDLTERLDGVRLDNIRVSTDEIQSAREGAPAELVAALELARDRIDFHHREQLRQPVDHCDSGVRIRSTFRPVASAGCYVPGGRAAYPSTLLMTAVPAMVAGVRRVVVCVPPDRATGAVPAATLLAAQVAGITELYSIGGAQAIAALAYGTASIDPVDVICGPGNMYVALAKQEVAGRVGIAAAFAGPSEVVVVADASAPADFAAADVVLQAEHGPDGLAWLVTWDESVADAVTAEIALQVQLAPRRSEITATLARSGYCVLVDSPDDAIRVVDLVAPEHLELICDNAELLADTVRNAGAIFCGPWSPASIGDYVAGPSHVLPTNGSARFASALTVDDFLTQQHVITVDPDGIGAVGPAARIIAEAEGLDAHAESIRLRERRLALGETE